MKDTENYVQAGSGVRQHGKYAAPVGIGSTGDLQVKVPSHGSLSGSDDTEGSRHGSGISQTPMDQQHVNRHMRSKTGKVSVVGCGAVGMAIATTILDRNLCNELMLIDVSAEKAMGEALDLRHGAAFFPFHIDVNSGGDPSYAEESDIIVITAGVRQREGESRLNLLARNVAVYQDIVPKLVAAAPHAIYIVVSNPCDVLTYATWKISGLPIHQVFGSGTNLDTSRLRNLIAREAGVSESLVAANVIGEHGDSSVACFSSATVAGMPIERYMGARFPDRSKKEWDAIYHSIQQQVVGGAGKVIKLKGYTSWAIGYSTASIIHSIIHNSGHMHPLSTLVRGNHMIEEGVFLSLPCVVGKSGIREVCPDMLLSAEEVLALHRSAKALKLQQDAVDDIIGHKMGRVSSSTDVSAVLPEDKVVGGPEPKTEVGEAALASLALGEGGPKGGKAGKAKPKAGPVTESRAAA